jgi:hypothetical protein
MRVIEERVVTGKEPGAPIEDVIRELGQEDLLDELRGA